MPRVEGFPKLDESVFNDTSVTPESAYREWLRLAAGITDQTKQMTLWLIERRKRAQWRKEHDERD